MMMNHPQQFGAETSKARSVGATLRRLGHYFRHYSWALLLVAGLIIGSTYMQVLIPDLTGQAVDCYLTPYTTAQAAGGAGGANLSSLGFSGEEAFSNCWYTTPRLDATAAETLSGLGGLILLIVGLYVGSAILSGLMYYVMSRSQNQFLHHHQPKE